MIVYISGNRAHLSLYDCYENEESEKFDGNLVDENLVRFGAKQSTIKRNDALPSGVPEKNDQKNGNLVILCA